MKFADAISKAYDTKWSFINSFRVEFHLPTQLKNFSGWSDEDDKSINLHIINIDTPQFTNSPIEVFVGNMWRVHNGRDELYRFSMTFRDKDQMDLYRKFLLMYKSTREGYFDDVKMTINLYKEADWKADNDKILFEFTDTLIESVSQVQFNNTTENQIAEFSVNFKTVIPYVYKNDDSRQTVITQR